MAARLPIHVIYRGLYLDLIRRKLCQGNARYDAVKLSQVQGGRETVVLWLSGEQRKNFSIWSRKNLIKSWETISLRLALQNRKTAKTDDLLAVISSTLSKDTMTHWRHSWRQLMHFLISVTQILSFLLLQTQKKSTKFPTLQDFAAKQLWCSQCHRSHLRGPVWWTAKAHAYTSPSSTAPAPRSPG